METRNTWVRQSYTWVFDTHNLTEHPASLAAQNPLLCRLSAHGLDKASARRLIELHRPMHFTNVLVADEAQPARPRIAFPEAGRGIRLRFPFTLEYRWHVPQMIGQVALQYRAEAGRALSPASADTHLEWHDGARWRSCPIRRVHVDDVGGIWAGKGTHLFYLIPRASERFRIRVEKPAGRRPVRLLNIDLLEAPDVQKLSHGWKKPGDLVSGSLPYMCAREEDWLPDRDARSIRALALPPYLPAMLGNPDGTARAAMAFNGMVCRLAPRYPAPHESDLLLTWFAWGDPPRMLGDTWMVRRGVSGPGLGAWTEEVRPPLTVRVMAVPQVASGKTPAGIAVTVTLRHNRPEPVTTYFMVGLAVSASEVGPFIPALLGPGNRVAWRANLSQDKRCVLDEHNTRLLESDHGGALVGADTEWGLLVPIRVPPGREKRLRFFLPDVAAPVRDPEYARKTWRQVLDGRGNMRTPDGEFADRHQHLLAQQVCGIERKGDRLVIPYGTTASTYQDCLFGIEEHYSCSALAMFGHASRACRVFQDTFMGDWCKPENNLHLAYRLARRATSGLRLYRLSGDRLFLDSLRPAFSEALEFASEKITATRNDPEPGFRGLFPEEWYGGDLRDTPARSVYNMAATVRGLLDAAAGWRALGHYAEAAQARFLAVRLRARLTDAVRHRYRHHAPNPFLPLNLLETDDVPGGGDYYQLFASLILETGAFPASGVVAHWIAEFMEKNNRLFLGLVRFAAGHDAVYSLGYLRHVLETGDADRFLTGVRAYLYLAMDDEVWTAQEVGQMAQKRSLSPGMYSKRLIKRPTAPLLAGSAIGLILIRHLFIHEPETPDCQPDGTLVLLPAVPREWWTDTASLQIKRLASVYGDVSVGKETRRSEVRLTIGLDTLRTPLREIHIPVRLPASARLAEIQPLTGGAVHLVSVPGADDPVAVIPVPRRRHVLSFRLSRR